MPKRDRPNRIKRVERHDKHVDMRRAAKKRKRQNIAQFKSNLMGVKRPKDHPLNKLDGAEDDEGPPAELTFKELLRQRAQARRARFDRWRNGRKSRGTVRLLGYALDPHALQAKLAVVTSRQAFTFQEPQLPYWMVPDEDDMPEEKEDSAEPAATPPVLLERLKMVHGDIVLTSPWEIVLYVDCLLQAGSKLIKNRHTTANRGAPAYFPTAPKDRQQCLTLLRSLHMSLVIPFWNLVEGKGDASLERSKVDGAAAQLKELLSSSNTQHLFNLKRPGVVEKWAAPLFQRLQVLNMWTPPTEFVEWIKSGSEEEATNQEAITAYHAQETTKRPDWIDAIDAKSVWQ